MCAAEKDPLRIFCLVAMEVAHLYVKTRKEFGKHCKFTAVPAAVLEAIPVTDAYQENYIVRNPSVSCFDTAPHMSDLSVSFSLSPSPSLYFSLSILGSISHVEVGQSMR